MSDSEKPASLRLFDEHFKDDEFVVIEDDSGAFHAGTLKRDRHGLYLRHATWQPTQYFKWEQIVFIAHDGFPVQAIRGMKDDEVEALCDATNEEVLRYSILHTVGKVRETFLRGREPSSSYIPTGIAWGPPPRGLIGGGCPFLFGPAEFVDLLHPGNSGLLWWGDSAEETLVLRCPDTGAFMHSYDLDHHFLFADLELPHRQMLAQCEEPDDERD